MQVAGQSSTIRSVFYDVNIGTSLCKLYFFKFYLKDINGSMH